MLTVKYQALSMVRSLQTPFCLSETLFLSCSDRLTPTRLWSLMSCVTFLMIFSSIHRLGRIPCLNFSKHLYFHSQLIFLFIYFTICHPTVLRVWWRQDPFSFFFSPLYSYYLPHNAFSIYIYGLTNCLTYWMKEWFSIISKALLWIPRSNFMLPSATN